MKKIVIGFVVVIVVVGGLFFGLFTYKNRPLQLDHFKYYENQDTTPVGKVGIFITGLVATSEHSSVFY